jgi:CRISPR-associated protein Csd2
MQASAVQLRSRSNGRRHCSLTIVAREESQRSRVPRARGDEPEDFTVRTGFTQADLDLLFEALLQMFEHDRSAARGEMVVRGLYDFEHVGTQHENNAVQNKREARLGCAHAHKLFEDTKVELTDEAKAKGCPESFADYYVDCDCDWTKDSVTGVWRKNNLPGVRLHKRHDM